MKSLIYLVLFPALINGHASLIEPPSRASMWNYGFPENPTDYQHNQGFCGGFGHQFSPAIGGRCGICGDPWDANPREHEAPGGKYANGIITRTYKPGQDIIVKVLVTYSHKGYFTFRLCKNNDITLDPGQECFEDPESLLQTVPSGDYRFPVTDAGEMELMVRLPEWECEQCILQWTYTAGNNWGTCEDGTGRLGCGPQEHFRACSDISVSGTPVILPPLPTATIPTATQPAPDTSTQSTVTGGVSGNTCVSVGEWAGDQAMAQWCYHNCFAAVPNCPTDRCDCVQTVTPTVLSCHAIGPWLGNPGMDTWCYTNCNHSSPYCPESMCVCD